MIIILSETSSGLGHKNTLRMNKKQANRYYPHELMPFVWCTACLGVVLEQSDEANDIFEDIIDCLDLPGWKELTEKVENELPGSESLMKQIVKESGYDFHKPPSKENIQRYL